MSTSYYRIIDANINRACEGLRVIEDYIRFVLSDKRYSELAKQYRHKLRQIGVSLNPDNLLAGRAADADVGRDIPSPSDVSKTDSQAIVTASFKRVQEALRVIEEYCRLIEPQISKQVGNLRFEIYQLERDLLKILPRNKFENVKLYLLIGSDVWPAEKIEEQAKMLFDAGVDCLQLREKKLPDREIFTLAERLAKIAHQREKIFIVNDRADIALACGADGVHLGQDDLPKLIAEKIINPNQIIGLSTHNIEQVEDAISLEPTYIAIGPAFKTATKPTEPVAGLEFIESAIAKLNAANIPEVAIGGINLDNIEKLLSIGVRRIAICSAILSSENPAEQTKKFQRLLG